MEVKFLREVRKVTSASIVYSLEPGNQRTKEKITKDQWQNILSYFLR
jgi:hypothetical protein